MAMRSLGSFTLRHSLVSFKVKTYKTFDDAEVGLKFNHLHGTCHTPINLRNFCSKCDRTVEYAELVKGHEHAPGQYVVFTPEEIKSCGDDTSVDLTLDSFVPLDGIPAIQFEGTANFLAPESKGDARSFATIQQAMAAEGVYGLGRLVTRGGHDHLVAVKAEGKLLLMYRLRPFVTLRKVEDVPQYGALPTTVNSAELALAEQLIRHATTTFRPEDAVSERSDRLKDLLKAKLSGEPMPNAPVAEPAPTVSDLMTALRESLAQAA